LREAIEKLMASANAFPNDESVNKVLQLIRKRAKVPQLQKVAASV
jgi:hypothetical protein